MLFSNEIPLLKFTSCVKFYFCSEIIFSNKMSLLTFKICCQKTKVVSNIIKTNVLTYCLKSKRNTEKKECKMIKTKNGRVILSSKCAICGSKKSRFMKEQEAKGLLTNFGIRIPLSKIPLLGDLLF